MDMSTPTNSKSLSFKLSDATHKLSCESVSMSGNRQTRFKPCVVLGETPSGRFRVAVLKPSLLIDDLANPDVDFSIGYYEKKRISRLDPKSPYLSLKSRAAPVIDSPASYNFDFLQNGNADAINALFLALNEDYLFKFSIPLTEQPDGLIPVGTLGDSRDYGVKFILDKKGTTAPASNSIHLTPIIGYAGDTVTANGFTLVVSSVHLALDSNNKPCWYYSFDVTGKTNNSQ